MPERTGDPDLIDSLDITPPKEDLPAHQKPGLSLTVSLPLLPLSSSLLLKIFKFKFDWMRYRQMKCGWLVAEGMGPLLCVHWNF
jgi:hypothetical protein